MELTIEWQLIDEDRQDLWHLTRCLYLYSTTRNEVLYIGKACSMASSVKKRWNRSAKRRCWDLLETELGVFEHRVLVGSLLLPPGKRHSPQLLGDVETLLINCLAPPANKAAVRNRISRPGLSVICRGDWFHPVRKFTDV